MCEFETIWQQCMEASERLIGVREHCDIVNRRCPEIVSNAFRLYIKVEHILNDMLVR